MVKQVCRAWAIANSLTRVSELNSSSCIVRPHFLRLHDLLDPDFARSKLSYRGRTSRRLCKISFFLFITNTKREAKWEFGKIFKTVMAHTVSYSELTYWFVY